LQITDLLFLSKMRTTEWFDSFQASF